MWKSKHKNRNEKSKLHYHAHRKQQSHSSRPKDGDSNLGKKADIYFHEQHLKELDENCDSVGVVASLPSTSKQHVNYPHHMELDFSWFEHRSVLNKMFFRDKDVIKRRTQEYDDFWAFLKKYQSMQMKSDKRKVSYWKNADYSINTKWQQDKERDLGLPNSYDKRYKINFSIVTGDIKELLVRGHLFKDDSETGLTKERIMEFRYVLHLYIDFLQKQKFAKVKKLRHDQANLPISYFRNEIISTVSNNQVVLVAGDTGCGKSTQVPQYLLASGFDSIACTQPRRIACISLSKRVAYETLNDYGSEVGYQIRFERSKTSHTKILFLTEGLLLRQVSSDPTLTNYKVVILDEVHERHLPCDFLLGIMKCLTIQRPDLKIVLMSATINIQLFSEYFNDCPVIQVPGRLFPIQMYYFPVPVDEKKTQNGKLNPAPYIRILNMIDHKYPATERGDLLIFLSGLTEISIVEEAARQYAEKTKSWIILPLHSTLSIEEQDKVFDIAPESVRKCIISTNIAETSVTIDGVRFVADSGKVKEMSYDPNSRMQRLQEFWISRASAEQRKGRAGRTGPGVCFRLYSEQEYDALFAYPKPEIQRVSLDSLLLQMISLGLPDGRKFPFLEPPCITSIEESLQNLKEQGALTNMETLTPMGQMLSRLPVEVTIGKMLIHGCMFSLMEPMLSLAAAMSVNSPFTNRSIKDPEIMTARRFLESDHGDPFTLLNAYRKWLENKSDHHCNSRKWCKRYGLEEQRFYAISKLRKQFKELLVDSGLLLQDEMFHNSHDRAVRFGELKQLKDIKKEFHRAPKRRKILRIESCIEGFAEDQEEAEEDGIDIKDVEFRMSFDKRQVHNLSCASQITSFRDLMCLKILICSGLYPRLAIADVHNSYKADSEQLFHTKGKPFTFLHPNGVLALQPDVLQLREEDIQEKKGISSHSPLSSKHQLVAYMSLLETTKPYLVNCLRVPSCHMLLLLSSSIDTNQDFTRLVCDTWLEVQFSDSEVAQEFVSKAWYIRDLWQKLIQESFNELSFHREDKRTNEIQSMGKKLQNALVKYLQTEVVYSIKRLLPADIKNLYVGPSEGSVPIPVSFLSESELISENSVKGGLQMKEYLVYNCLADPDEKYLQYMQKRWTCIVCGLEMVATVLDQIRHKEICQLSGDDAKVKDVINESTLNPLKKPYFCPECQEEIFLTATETLRHKRTHLKL